jgi:hypothetical protein
MHILEKTIIVMVHSGLSEEIKVVDMALYGERSNLLVTPMKCVVF